MSTLKERPVKISRPEDINPRNIEDLMRHVDDNFRRVDQRRIPQLTTLSSGASADDIATKLNELIASLNGSDLTEND